MVQAKNRDEENVLALYAAGGSGDWVAAQNLVTPDFALREPECFSFGGLYKGLEALQAFYSAIFAAAGPTDIEINAITSGDDHVVVLLSLHMHEHGVVAQVAEDFRLENGKIALITAYYLDPPRVAGIYAGVEDSIRVNFPSVKREAN